MKQKTIALVFVGIILASGSLITTADTPIGQGQKIIDRWNNIIDNADAITDEMEEKYNVTVLRQIIETMENTKNKINPDAKRKEHSQEIEEFLTQIDDFKIEVKRLDPERRPILLRKKD